MDEKTLQAIEERAEAATEGPWEHDSRCRVIFGSRRPDPEEPDLREEVCDDAVPIRRPEDLAFITAARSDVPALVAEVRRLQEALRESEHWKAAFDKDRAHAREARELWRERAEKAEAELARALEK